jgi:hypothetical protein
VYNLTTNYGDANMLPDQTVPANPAEDDAAKSTEAETPEDQDQAGDGTEEEPEDGDDEGSDE